MGPPHDWMQYAESDAKDRSRNNQSLLRGPGRLDTIKKVSTSCTESGPPLRRSSDLRNSSHLSSTVLCVVFQTSIIRRHEQFLN